jgi:hypothetical protein
VCQSDVERHGNVKKSSPRKRAQQMQATREYVSGPQAISIQWRRDKRTINGIRADLAAEMPKH